MSDIERSEWPNRLLRLGLSVQDRVVASLRRSSATGNFDGAIAVAEESGDRIYGLDRAIEPALISAIRQWPISCFPLILICEGLGASGCLLFAAPNDEPQAVEPSALSQSVAGRNAAWQLIIDPIDGTRQLMYDKRSAWFLAAVAENRGAATTLSDSIASVLVELPISRQSLADAFVCEAGSATRGLRVSCAATGLSDKTGSSIISRLNAAQSIAVRPSQASDLTDGFLTVVGCFPGTRRLAADLAETIAEKLGADTALPQFFDDQYISTGGQMTQLMTGRDRACIDLRPLFNRILGRTGADRFVEVHPYDAAGLLAARQAGVIVTDGFERPLDAPFDVTTGLHWCGYANTAIQSLIQPIVTAWLSKHGVSPESVTVD